MRRPKKSLARTQSSRVYSISSPVGGLNFRDSLARMDEKDAIKLDNFFCTPYDVTARSGYTIQTSGIPSQVNTLASYVPSVAGAAKLFAWSADKVYDCTAQGALGSPVVSGNSTNTFQAVNFGTNAGAFLYAVSGGDLPLIYNGTVWSNVFSSAFVTTIATLNSVGTVATCTMATPHNLKTGMSVTIAGCTPAGYNGTYVITVTSTTAFTYVLAAPLGVVTVLGTATPVVNAAITGVDPASFNQLMVHQTRLWFIEKNSLRVWYLPSLSLGGAANVVDFSSRFNMGGHLVAMSNWSLDAGQGMDDYAVFVSSEGQVAVYKGTDPASSATWALTGIFDLGKPVGNRCLSKYAGDILYMSQDGLVPLSKALMSTRVNQKLALTDKVQHTITRYVDLYGSTFGWQTVMLPKNNMLLLNVPLSNTLSIQFAMNTISGAWSSFSGWNANCWVLHEDEIYFGSGAFIGKAWSGTTDNGEDIRIEAQQSFNYFGNVSQLKHVKMARPVISTDGTPSLLFGVNADFDTTTPTGVLSVAPTTYALWDSSLWDVGVWGGEPVIRKDWQMASSIGYCLAAHLVGNISNVQFNWSSTDFLLQNGGVV